MENNNGQLTKLALAAIVLASSASGQLLADENGTQTYLAAKCGAGSCGGQSANKPGNSGNNYSSRNNQNYNGRNEISMSDEDAVPVQPKVGGGSCGAQKNAGASCSAQKNGGGSCGAQKNGGGSCGAQRNGGSNSDYRNGGGSCSSNKAPNKPETPPATEGKYSRNYNDAYYYQADATPSNPSGYYSTTPSQDANSNMYKTTTDYNTNRNYNTYPSNNGYDTQRGSTTATTQGYDTAVQGSLSETELWKQLNPQARAIYQSLDSEGKALALQLASQSSYQDKNLAVQEAQRRTNERRGISGNTNK